jgi:hypothetical protein
MVILCIAATYISIVLGMATGRWIIDRLDLSTNPDNIAKPNFWSLVTIYWWESLKHPYLLWE